MMASVVNILEYYEDTLEWYLKQSRKSVGKESLWKKGKYFENQTTT